MSEKLNEQHQRKHLDAVKHWQSALENYQVMKKQADEAQTLVAKAYHQMIHYQNVVAGMQPLVPPDYGKVVNPLEVYAQNIEPTPAIGSWVTEQENLDNKGPTL